MARRARVVVASCASAGLLADAYVDDVVARWTVADGALSPGTIDVPYPDAATAAAERAAFTHVFVDEAGQATTPETLVPLRLATRRTSVVLSGDPAQLGPTVHSVVAGRGRCDDDDDDDDDGDGEMTPGLTTTMLEMASGGGCGARATRLVRNYRSHRDIIDLSSRLFYRDGLVACAREETTALPRVLTSAPSTSTRGAGSGLPLAATRGNESLGFVDDDQDDDDDDDDEGHLAAAAAVTRSRVVFYAVKGAQTRESARGDSPSYYNPIEAHALVELLAGWLDRDAARGDDADAAKDGGAGASAVYASPRLRASDVGVIAPYRAQVVRLRHAASRARAGRGARRHGGRLPGPGGEGGVHLRDGDEDAAPRAPPRGGDDDRGRAARLPRVPASIQRRDDARQVSQRRRRSSERAVSLAALGRAVTAMRAGRRVLRAGDGRRERRGAE